MALPFHISEHGFVPYPWRYQPPFAWEHLCSCCCTWPGALLIKGQILTPGLDFPAWPQNILLTPDCLGGLDSLQTLATTPEWLFSGLECQACWPVGPRGWKTRSVFRILWHHAMDSSDNALGLAGLPVKSPALPAPVLAQLSTGPLSNLSVPLQNLSQIYLPPEISNLSVPLQNPSHFQSKTFQWDLVQACFITVKFIFIKGQI